MVCVSKDKELVLAAITGTKGNPTKLSTIRRVTGFSRKKVTESIRLLREEYPICSTKNAPGGYWLGDADDLRVNIMVLNAEANTTFETANNLSNLLHKMEGHNGF